MMAIEALPSIKLFKNITYIFLSHVIFVPSPAAMFVLAAAVVVVAAGAAAVAVVAAGAAAGPAGTQSTTNDSQQTHSSDNDVLYSDLLRENTSSFTYLENNWTGNHWTHGQETAKRKFGRLASSEGIESSYRLLDLTELLVSIRNESSGFDWIDNKSKYKIVSLFVRVVISSSYRWSFRGAAIPNVRWRLVICRTFRASKLSKLAFLCVNS